MLAMRGPRAFFIQDIRSSACSCVRRSEAAEEEIKQQSQDHRHDGDSCPLTGHMSEEQTRLAVLKLLLLVVIHHDVGLD